MLLPTVSRRVWLGVKPHLGPKTRFLLLSDSCGFVHVGALSLMRGRICRLQLLLTLASAVIFTAVRISSTCHLYLQFYMSAFYKVSCEESRSLWTPTIYSFTCLPESGSYITIDGQSASLSWSKAPIWGLRPDFYYCRTATGLLMWGALSDERTGLSFRIAASLLQRSHFRIRVPWDSWPYFTVSDSRLPFSSPPTTLGAAAEVFDPASTRDMFTCQSESHIATDGQSVLVSSPIWGSWPDIYYCLTVTVLLLWGVLPEERTGLSFVRVIVCSSKSFVIM
jgi:hypothetical protein